jgi:6-phosphogluconolactonase
VRDERQAEAEALRTIVTEDPEALAEAGGDFLLAVIQEAVAARGAASVVLAGGATPRMAYARLAEGLAARAVPLNGITWFFGDERWVPRDDVQSNEGMARAALLRPIGAPEQTIMSWNAGVGSAIDRTRDYAGRVAAAMAQNAGAPDLVVLGIGADGHTASLFPGAAAILPDGRRVPVAPRMGAIAAAVEGIPGRDWRLTLCPDFLRTTRQVVFLVSGTDKRAALGRARRGDPAAPAAWIRGARTYFIVTRDAMGADQDPG